MAPPMIPKQGRIAPQPASDARSRRDQTKWPPSVSGMPGFPPGMNSLVEAPEKKRLPCTEADSGQAFAQGERALRPRSACGALSRALRRRAPRAEWLTEK